MSRSEICLFTPLMKVQAGNLSHHIHHGDVIPHMLADMEPACIDFAITSPPFPAMFAYNDSEADVGNSEDDVDMKIHLSFFFRGLARVLKPGRATVIHCMQLPLLKRSGKAGVSDFRGLLIRCGLRAGLVYDFDWIVTKNAQAQAIRNKSWQLKFQGLETDRAQCRGALGDYLLKFRAPGENEVPVQGEGQVTRNDWIKWADGAWDDINEQDTLNAAAGDAVGDTRHICPLQLEIIERCVRLYTNPGEIVFDPFMGVGSTAFVCLGGVSPKTKRQLLDTRRAYGCELKESYHAAAWHNCARAERQAKESQRDLFSGLVPTT